jgi:outer membrane receptor protein involved in Fe transport
MAFRAARTTSSAFAGWSLHREAGTLEANLRHDAPSGLDARTSGRAAASQALAGGLGLKTSLATGFRPPTLYELYDPGALPGTSVANPDLRPETSVSSDGGLYFQAGEAFYVEALAFRQETRQTIVALPAPSSPNLFRFENVNRTRSTGVEAALHARMPLGFSLDLAWTRTDAVILDNDAADPRDNGNRVPGVPRERWNASAAWRQGGWHAWLQARYSGRRYVDTANTRYLQPYTLFDAGLNVPLGHGFELGVEGRNLTNVTYAELDNYPPPGTQGFLTLRWKWGGGDLGAAP